MRSSSNTRASISSTGAKACSAVPVERRVHRGGHLRGIQPAAQESIDPAGDGARIADCRVVVYGQQSRPRPVRQHDLHAGERAHLLVPEHAPLFGRCDRVI